MTFGYGYDNASRIATQPTVWNTGLPALATRTSATETFTYDNAGQLTFVNEVGGPGDGDYIYGPNGNRTTATEPSGGTDNYTPGAQNRVSQDSTYSYEYDAEGNLAFSYKTNDPGDRTYYTWDHRNRLVNVEHLNGDHAEPIVAYRYNAGDELVYRRLDEPFSGQVNVVEHYVLEAGERVMTLDSDGDLLRRYHYGPAGEALFDQVFDGAGNPSSQAEVDLRLPLSDHQNSTRVVLGHDANDAAYIRQSIDYAPFGSITSIKDAAGQTTTAALDTAFAHHGSMLDATTKLQLKGARWYSPDLGRFVSVDPIEDGANWYAFAGNDPVNYADPSGLSANFHPLGNSTLSTSYVNAKSILNPGGLNLNLSGSYLTGPVAPSYSSTSSLNFQPVNFGFGGQPSSSSYNALANFATPAISTYQPSGLSPAFGTNGFRNDLSAIASVSQPTTPFVPRDPQVVSVERINSGRPGREVERYGVSQFTAGADSGSIGQQAGGFAAMVAGRLIDTVFPASSPSYRVTYNTGQTVIQLGGDVAETGKALALGTAFLPTGTRPTTTPTTIQRGPVAQTAPGKNFIPVTHVEAAAGEFDLIQTVQRQGEVVLRANRTITDNGADLITYNPQKGQVTLWDNKNTNGRLTSSGARAPRTISPSRTLNENPQLSNALRDAQEAIQNSNLPAADRARALQSIENETYRKVTRGSGNAKNSVIQYGP